MIYIRLRNITAEEIEEINFEVMGGREGLWNVVLFLGP